MSRIKVNDLTVNYEKNGAGRPLFILPGLLGTIESDWRRLIPELSENHCTIAVDLRGHGKTDNPDRSNPNTPGELDLDRMADDLVGLIDALGYEKVSVLGYSLGGCLGLMAGLKRPGLINALIMHATKFFWGSDDVTRMQASLDPAMILEKSPRYAQSLRDNHREIYGEDYWKHLMQIATRFIGTMPYRTPALEQCGSASFPVLVSAGDHDQMISLEESVRLYRAFPEGNLAVLPAVRHPVSTVKAGAFLPIVQSFLSGITET